MVDTPRQTRQICPPPSSYPPPPLTEASIQDAENFAEIAHRGQVYGNYPYTVHTRAVAKVMAHVLKDAPDNVRLTGICAAHLHDTMEDTDVTWWDLVDRYGHEVADAVRDVSHPPGLPRARRVHVMIALLKGAPELSVNLKLADRLANMEAALGVDDGLSSIVSHPSQLYMARMYAREMPFLRQACDGRGSVELHQRLTEYEKRARALVV